MKKSLLDSIRQPDWIDNFWRNLAQRRADKLQESIQQKSNKLAGWMEMREQRIAQFDAQVSHLRRDMLTRIDIDELALKRDLAEDKHQLDLLLRDIGAVEGNSK